MNSLRQQLLLGTAAATILIFVAAAATLYFLSRHFLLSEFDATLRTRVQTIASLTEFDLSQMRLDVDDAMQIVEFSRSTDPEYFEVSSDDDRHVVLSPTLKGQRLDRRALAQQGATGAVKAFMPLPDGRPGRAVMIRAKTQPDDDRPSASGPEIAIIVAKSTEQLDRQLSRLRLLLVAVCSTATVVLLGLSGWVIRRAMRPVERLARQIGGLGADDLGERIDPAGAPKETVPIVVRLNELLGRLQAAFEREKSFTADVAHELRTPLAGLASALEVCARERRDVPRYERVVSDCLDVVWQMHAMVNNLLLLARADADQIPLNRAPVDIGGLLRASWASHESAAARRRLSIEIEIEDELEIQGDREKLAIIFNNLLGNAIQYANEAGQIWIAATVVEQRITVSVANTGSKVRRQDAEHVFDRFWRGDAARSFGGINCGLGLAVSRKLAEAMGARLWARCEAGGRFEIFLELPAAVRLNAQTLIS